MSDLHAIAMPARPPMPGTRWVRCYKLATGPSEEPGWRWEPVDLGIADLVEQLQRVTEPGGLPLVVTSSCCEGHGQYHAHVLLEDGRVLTVLERADFDALDYHHDRAASTP